jgi:ribosome-binding protein aMBF1 (putative translation factor)
MARFLKAEAGLVGAVGVENGPVMKSVNPAVSYILKRLSSQPALPNPSLTTREWNIIIRARYAAGESQADLAHEFDISYQRVHQIIQGKRK